MIVAILSVILGGSILYLVLRPGPRNGKQVPGPPGSLFFGNASQMSAESLQLTLEEWVTKYGKLVQLSAFGKRMLFLNSADIIHKEFDDSKSVMNDRPPYLYFSRFFPDQTILLHENGRGYEHKLMRKKFMEGFHVYGDGVKVFEDNVEGAIRSLLTTVESFQGREFECTLLMRHVVISMMSVFLSGEELQHDDHQTTAAIWDYIDALSTLNKSVKLNLVLKFPPSRYVPGIYRDINNAIKDNLAIIVEKYLTKPKATYVKGSNRGFVDFLIAEQQRELEAGNELIFTDDAIMGIISDICLGGISPTISSLSSMILCMINHPDIQRRVQAEIHEVVGKDRLPTLEDRARCPYTEAVSYETQRYISIIPLGVVHYCKEQTTLEGFHIPANTSVFANAWHVHHNEAVWGDPWTFRPERFLDDQGHLLPRTHSLYKNLMPFGTGIRQCVGDTLSWSRLFLYFSSMMQKWKFVPVPGKCGSCDPRTAQFDTHRLVRPRPFFCRAVEHDGSKI